MSSQPADVDQTPESAPCIRWRLFAMVFAALFLFRGLLLLCVLPPLEGWDEYQHVAYIVYLEENRTPPELGRSSVPVSLASLLRQYPHPAFSVEQTVRWGARGYADFWSGAAPATPATPTDIHLYQAQHPPLYYTLVRPVWSVLSRTNPLAAIYALRVLNLLFVSAAILAFALAAEKFISRMQYRLILLLVVACHPLYLMNAARVANDALAILFGAVAVSLMLLSCDEKSWRSLPLAAIAIGAGVLTKHTTLVLAPVWLVAFLLSLRNRPLFRRRLVAGIAGLLILCAMIGPHLLSNYRKYGSISSTQEARVLRESGKTTADMLKAAVSVPWHRHFRKLLLPGALWMGGWSFLWLPDGWEDFHEYIMRGAKWALIAGAALALWRKLRRRAPAIPLDARLFSNGTAAVISALVVLAMSAGMAYHTLLLRVAWGIPQTNPWYFMLATPTWLALVLQAVLLVDRRLFALFGVLLSAFYLVADFVGVFCIMPPFYAATRQPADIWRRLGDIHPAFPHPAYRFILLLAVAVTFLFILWSAYRCWRQDFRLSCALTRSRSA